MVFDGVSHRKTAIIYRTGAADCARRFPVTGHSRIVDHLERIGRRFLHRNWFSHSARSSESRPWNDRRALYQCGAARRLAESSALPNYLHRSNLQRPWQVFSRSLATNPEEKAEPTSNVGASARCFQSRFRSNIKPLTSDV